MKKYTIEELIEKAQSLNRDTLFITILKERPLYPIEFTDHDIPEFGMKIKANGQGENNKWLLGFECGYVLGKTYKNGGRSTDWFECVFPSVDLGGDPKEYVVGLYDNEFDFLTINHQQ